ncbi:hypothetical protein LC724_00095 [Blautia sp. RD014234]|nr:hypothetical protein [Blautia parvula]
MLAGKPETFHSPGEDFLAEYALFGKNGEVLECNVKGKMLKALKDLLQEESQEADTLRYTYADGSTVIFHWYYRAEFADPVLRNRLPPFEYLWIATFFAAVAFCVLGNTLWLRRRLAARLKLFSEVSEKVGAQELDFVIPHAGIREYDQALDAMEHMREALYSSLSSQWAAQQERETEIAALAHDLKTPLTLVGGNAELLLEEELSENSRKMVKRSCPAMNGQNSMWPACWKPQPARKRHLHIPACLLCSRNSAGIQQGLRKQRESACKPKTAWRVVRRFRKSICCVPLAMWYKMP